MNLKSIICLLAVASGPFLYGQMNIYIASAPWCGPCHVLMQHLGKKEIPYTKVSEIKNDSLRSKLKNWVKIYKTGIPVTFIDTSGNNFYEDSEPFVVGSIPAEGLIDILKNDHPTITLENYHRYFNLAKGVFEKYNKSKFEGEIRDETYANDSIMIHGVKYHAVVKKDTNQINATYSTKEKELLYVYSFDFYVFNKDIHTLKFGRLITPADPAKRNNIKSSTPPFTIVSNETLDTNIPAAIFQHFCAYMHKINTLAD